MEFINKIHIPLNIFIYLNNYLALVEAGAGTGAAAGATTGAGMLIPRAPIIFITLSFKEPAILIASVNFSFLKFSCAFVHSSLAEASPALASSNLSFFSLAGSLLSLERASTLPWTSSIILGRSWLVSVHFLVSSSFLTLAAAITPFALMGRRVASSRAA